LIIIYFATLVTELIFIYCSRRECTENCSCERRVSIHNSWSAIHTCSLQDRHKPITSLGEERQSLPSFSCTFAQCLIL